MKSGNPMGRRMGHPRYSSAPPPWSAGFHTCCAADFPVGHFNNTGGRRMGRSALQNGRVDSLFQSTPSVIQIAALELIYLCLAAFLAGLVDALVGGGGLIQLPALLVFLPTSLAAAIPAVFGTNKFSSLCGTSLAVIQYSRRVRIRWKSVLPAAFAALVLSWIGARTVSRLNPAVLKPVVLVLLVAVAFQIYRRKSLGDLHAPRMAANAERFWALLVGAAIGFYDGFFGPGTGSFLIFIFVGWFGFDFLHASASAKVINFATNLSAVAYFAATDQIYYHYAVPMALCNVAGAVTGTQLAILKGNRFIRIFFLVVVSLLILRFGYEILWKP